MTDVVDTLELPLPFGVSAVTGRPLAGLSPDDIRAFTKSAPATARERQMVETRASASDAAFALVGEVDPNDLSQAGWAVLYAPDVPNDVKQALEPLIARRKSQAGSLFKVFEGAAGYRQGEGAIKWITRNGGSMNVVDPLLGIPYYLLLVGSPEQIPFEFQYTLDIFWAVGRLHFHSADEYRRYADSVVAYETTAAPPTGKQLALFATTHDFDRATQAFTSKVAKPLADGTQTHPPIGQRQHFARRPSIGEAATKERLRDIFRGTTEGGPPALLFSGTHGMGFDAGDPRLPAIQGALVCQDWGGYGAIDSTAWFAADDVPADAKVHGLIHVLFACYGAGCPKHDNFNRAAGPKQIAPAAMMAALPQRLLAHQNGGALAVIGHVERAWGYSFLSDRGSSQTQGFRDVIGRLMRGERAGQAFDQFNVRWAALSTDLSETLDTMAHGGEVSDAALANKWIARDDARNYIIFGDPAVRIRVEDMPDL